MARSARRHLGIAGALWDAVASASYERRSPEASVLYRIVRDHLETFRAQSASLRDGAGLPRFVDQAFTDFLRCGWLAGGFARFRCGGCGLDRLVAFSCKGRAVCPSCSGRRMTERTAHLVDEVLPDVPVRQWVLSVPYRLRYLLAWDHDLCRAVAAILSRAIFRVLRERATDAGVEGGQGGGVVVIQRFGGSLNLNVHFHALVLDGVFERLPDGATRFHLTRRLAPIDVDDVLATVEALVARRLRRAGLDSASEDSESLDRWADETPVLAELAATSVVGGGLVGAPQRVGRGRWLDEPPDDQVGAGGESRGLVARSQGYSLHAGQVVAAGRRERLEQVCRYVLRPPVAVERLQLTDSGQVHLTFKQPWRDGTTAVVFDPVTFLGRLAVLVPRPRTNLLLYYGVLGARSAWRAAVVAHGRGAADADRPEPHCAGDAAPARAIPTRNASWATLMRRAFGFDVLSCPRCGGRLRLLALITQAAVIERILVHIGASTAIPRPRPARAPPEPRKFAEFA